MFFRVLNKPDIITYIPGMGKIFIKKGHLRKCRKGEECPMANQKAKKKNKKIYNTTKSVNRVSNSKERSSFFQQRAARGLQATLCPMPSSVTYSHSWAAPVLLFCFSIFQCFCSVPVLVLLLASASAFVSQFSGGTW